MTGGAIAPGGAFWKGKRVFVTGHTGFKGSWLSLWLKSLGAEVTGYSLPPPTDPSLFMLADVGSLVKTVTADIRDGARLAKEMKTAAPEIVFHLAAQPIVLRSYEDPVETYETNVMGTLNFLNAVRDAGTVRSAVVITTDKVYENREWCWGYRENDHLGGYDPYSSSKACSEILTASYRSSFLNPARYEKHGVALATARAGNVIGGGDWAADRLVPDIIRSIVEGKPVILRNPGSIRPWQHVFDPLSGYLALAEKLHQCGPEYAQAWNFGPNDADCVTVLEVVQTICANWGEGASYRIEATDGKPHEANFLKLDCSKARNLLDWRPVLGIGQAAGTTVEWVKDYIQGADMREVSLAQIKRFKTA